MKIDLSSLFLVVLVLIPGLFAQRSRDLLVPRSLAPKGASEELAELVALGLATHGILIFLAALFALIIDITTERHLFHALDAWQISPWAAAHRSETLLLGTAYIFASFFVSHCLGLVYGGFSVKGRLTARWLERTNLLERFGIDGLLGEWPIIYELLNAETNAEGVAKRLFVEAEMKGDLGFYSGQLSQFAIVRDEESHRPVYLIEPWYKKERLDEYVQLSADGILLDLADVATLLLRQVDLSAEETEEQET